MTFRVRRIVVNATPVGHVWYDKRWKWIRPHRTVEYRRNQGFADVIRSIAAFYCVSVDQVKVEVMRNG